MALQIIDSFSPALLRAKAQQYESEGLTEEAKLFRRIAATDERRTLYPSPQPGPQTMFLESEADIVIYGGAAGGGKTFGLFLEGVKDREIDGARFVYFRRQQTDINKAGGPWDKSMGFFPRFGAQPNKTSYKWKFPGGAEGQFASLQYDQDVLNWQTAEIDCFLFDELTHFTEFQFWYMLSRTRGPLKTKKRLRAGTNPNGASWVKRIIAPWVDDKWDGITYNADGVAYKAVGAVAGEIRYIARDSKGDVVWVDEDWRYPAEMDGKRPKPKSITFIPSSLSDNPELTKNDPDYISNLLMQDPVNAARLLRGDWDVVSGVYFTQWSNHRHVRDVEEVPRWYTWFGGWDYGKSAPFCFLLMAADENGNVVVVDEIYEAGVEDHQQAFRVKAMLEEYGLDPKEVIIWHDPAIGKDRTVDASSSNVITVKPFVVRPSEVFSDHGLKVKPADNDLLSGWSRVRQYLNATPDPSMPPDLLLGPYLTVQRRCRNLIRTLPHLPPDKKEERVVDTHAEDHAADALRYGLMSRPRKATDPEKAKQLALLARLGIEAAKRPNSVKGDKYTGRRIGRVTG